MLGKGVVGGGGGTKAPKPSFVSYVRPEEIHTNEKEVTEKEVTLHLLPGEQLLCEASTVLKYVQEDSCQRGIYGKLVCTDFKIAFLGDDDSALDNDETQFKNKVIGENDITLHCVDQIYGVFDEKKKTLFGQLKKYPEKLIIHCKDLRVFHFCLRYTKEEEVKRIVSGIIHHTQAPKLLKRLFLFSYAAAAQNHAATDPRNHTVMFDTLKDWCWELERTKGSVKYKAVSVNEGYKVCERLPAYFVVPTPLPEEDLSRFQGHGIPLWCWSCHNGCALLKMSALPKKEQDDGLSQMQKSFLDGIYKTIHRPPYEIVKTEDLSSNFLSLQDIQTAYSKFKQLFLIDNSTEFWDTDIKWFSLLESSSWLDIIRRCLKKAIEITECLEAQNVNVLLLEENASDLCCLVSSLVQVMMDPHCRTRIGFQSLVQKEWIMGGHSFLDRCNHLRQSDKEEVPVFLLFLDCVWQLVHQHPPAFDFTETYLTVLSDSLYIPIFSTFFFNSPHQKDNVGRESQDTQSKPLNLLTVWDWSVQFEPKAQMLLKNPLYVEKPKLDKGQRKGMRFKGPQGRGGRFSSWFSLFPASWTRTALSSGTAWPEHQRQLSLPLTQSKSSPKRGFFREETDHLIKNLLGKRISKLINSSDELHDNLREFYDSWHSKPTDYHGLLLPHIEGPEIKVWAQRYLRWIPEAQILGGGRAATVSKLLEMMEEVERLQEKIDARPHGQGALLAEAPLLLRGSARLSALFPFALLQRHPSKPVLPTSGWKALGDEEDLAKREDEFVDLGDV
ncbi:myotubularin-related protein 12 isoform X2 [Panthera pardus]|uniref:Myotubularin-related protein 12 n=1 Tax=Panthera pardus TaxID=9691 RepID=A0A9V1FNV3_PANPR|nr:myotubularin-related protein 12 isoform X2 [Panthera pardus]XP_042808485.1 myotubularin-related protein 12 isoform X1 [Panthera leo]XP_042852945.1 myotubularin-related protein 12 isoform X1 [Panthera tigris]XP_060490408.1 myotubularin-related protein 12 isoform X2 [Panthera onca]